MTNNITCINYFRRYFRHSKLVWSRSGTALASLPYFQQDGCLTIRNVNGERAGEYTCRATNQFGMSEVTSEVVYTGNVICHGRNFF